MRALPGLPMEIRKASGAGDTRRLSLRAGNKENKGKSSSGGRGQAMARKRRAKAREVALASFPFDVLSSLARRVFSTLPGCPKEAFTAPRARPCVVTLVPGFALRKEGKREWKENRKRNREDRRRRRSSLTFFEATSRFLTFSPLSESSLFPFLSFHFYFSSIFFFRAKGEFLLSRFFLGTHAQAAVPFSCWPSTAARPGGRCSPPAGRRRRAKKATAFVADARPSSRLRRAPGLQLRLAQGPTPRPRPERTSPPTLGKCTPMTLNDAKPANTIHAW